MSQTTSSTVEANRLGLGPGDRRFESCLLDQRAEGKTVEPKSLYLFDSGCKSHWPNQIMKTLTIIEWQLIPWSHKGYTGNGCQTYIEINSKRTEVQVVDKNGKRISHVGWPEEHFKDDLES